MFIDTVVFQSSLSKKLLSEFNSVYSKTTVDDGWLLLFLNIIQDNVDVEERAGCSSTAVEQWQCWHSSLWAVMYRWGKSGAWCKRSVTSFLLVTVCHPWAGWQFRAGQNKPEAPGECVCAPGGLSCHRVQFKTDVSSNVLACGSSEGSF